MSMIKTIFVIILILIIVGLLLVPSFTKGLLTGAASAVKSGITGLF